ncbi:MAG: glycosyltransferase family 1 protein [Hyphomicrobiales bacterium]|nr:MAG: glycosyltransferase family 1 protein [Hyphomicrobiales bacterium]
MLSNHGPEFAILDKPVLLCFSHLRWDFVYQRPQHLMSHAMRDYRVFYIEEPLIEPVQPHLRVVLDSSGVTVVTPVFDHHRDPLEEQRRLVSGFLAMLKPSRIVQWFYTPMALPIAESIASDLIIYDCMDELSAFRFAPAELRQREADLLARADLVFTGGASLFAAKRDLHDSAHCFPSSVDKAHFGKARQNPADPGDQAGLPNPRIGYFGVIDERMDLDLVAQVAADLADVQFVMVGPVVKIDQNDLPRASNIHWLGGRTYADLPAYLGNWQAGWMPFALNESTRFISPTKTPEFLAAGLPVTSTAVRDVVAGWGDEGLVRIADKGSMAAALRASLSAQPADWLEQVDRRLALMSWDQTWGEMHALMAAKLRVAESA